MSRYSPEVTPTGVSPLGALLRSGSQSYLQGREQRRKERLREQREERLQELYDMRQRQNEIEMARQGYRPEGATGPASIEEASRPQPGDPSTPTQGGFRSAADQIPEDAGNLSEALRTARGERETGPFTPGDIREGVIPPAVAMEMERMPGRVSLPSGGSVPEVPPREQRERDRREEEQSELARLLREGGISDPRADVLSRGTDMPKPRPRVPTTQELIDLGASDEAAESVEGDPEAARALRNSLIGPEEETDVQDVDVEDTRAYNRAIVMAEEGASLDEIQRSTGLTRVQAIDAAQMGKEAQQADQTVMQDATNQRFDDPANPIERLSRDLFVQLGSPDAVLRRFDRQAATISEQAPDIDTVDVPQEAVDRFVETVSMDQVRQEFEDLSPRQEAAVQFKGLKQMRSIASDYFGANEDAIDELSGQFPGLSALMRLQSQ